jgi:hypothetical protein
MPLVLGNCFPCLELNSFASTLPGLPVWVFVRINFVVNLFTVAARESQRELLSILLRPCTLLGLKYGDLGFSFSHHFMFVVDLGVSISWLCIFFKILHLVQERMFKIAWIICPTSESLKVFFFSEFHINLCCSFPLQGFWWKSIRLGLNFEFLCQFLVARLCEVNFFFVSSESWFMTQAQQNLFSHLD